jgi:uncharacterized cofD-like protein
LKIVSIGGGNGLSTLLRGLKHYAIEGAGSVELTAVVTVSDDGGSSGRLRRDFDVLPPGDIRNCMVALSRDEAFITRLFQYRFATGRGLKGHSFGNLFLTAMTNLTGDFCQAVKLSHEVLPVMGRIYPATSANVVLEATLSNGTRVQGETRISRSKSRIERVQLRPRHPKPLPEVLQAIAQADLITLGPGSLFTSVIPNLLVDGLAEAIAASPATKAYFVNLMSQPGETDAFTASEHVAAILNHARCDVVDVCVINNASIRGKALDKYQERAARPVDVDLNKLKAMGLDVYPAALLMLSSINGTEKIRHDPDALAAVAIDLAQGSRRRRLAALQHPEIIPPILAHTRSQTRISPVNANSAKAFGKAKAASTKPRPRKRK